MARYFSKYDDGDEEESYEAEGEDECGDDDDEVSVIACPYCKRSIHEDAQRCPYCEQYISEEDAPITPRPWWIVLGAFVCLYIVFRWITG